MQKRKYRPGFFVQVHKNNSSARQSNVPSRHVPSLPGHETKGTSNGAETPEIRTSMVVLPPLASMVTTVRLYVKTSNKPGGDLLNTGIPSKTKKPSQGEETPKIKVTAPGAWQSFLLGLGSFVFPVTWAIIVLPASGIIPVIAMVGVTFIICLFSILSGAHALSLERKNPDILKGRALAITGITLSWIVFATLALITLILLVALL